jgi:hypothetical protein
MGQRLGVSWQKANNYWSSFATLFFDIKDQFANNAYGPEWNFTKWLMVKAGLAEEQCMRQLKNYKDAIAADQNEKIAARNAEIERQKRAAKIADAEERNKQLTEKQRLAAEAKALKDANKQAKQASAKAKKASEAAKKGAATKKAKLAAFTPNADKTLPQLANDIHTGETKCHHGKQEMVNGIMIISIAMATARKKFENDDLGFNDWLKQNNINYSKDDRAAYINMGLIPDETRKVLGDTNRNSPRYIWELELKPKTNVISIA